MNDLGTLCLIAVLITVVVLLIPRLMGGFGRPDYSQRGEESPQYDDPNIRSRGSFGRRPSVFSRRQRGSSGGPRYDSPKVRSRGSFGRSKD
jgi:hypothetical protein